MNDAAVSAAQHLYDDLSAEALTRPGVRPGRSLRGGTLTVGGKTFAFLHGDRLIVKLPAARAADLVARTGAVHFEAGGRLMREWISVGEPEDGEAWRALLDEAYAYVRELGGRRR